jgi:hypothetical protein
MCTQATHTQSSRYVNALELVNPRYPVSSATLHHGVPDEARIRYPTLIDIDTSCSFSPTPENTNAIAKAEKDANDLCDSLNGSNRHIRRRTT